VWSGEAPLRGVNRIEDFGGMAEAMPFPNPAELRLVWTAGVGVSTRALWATGTRTRVSALHELTRAWMGGRSRARRVFLPTGASAVWSREAPLRGVNRIEDFGGMAEAMPFPNPAELRLVWTAGVGVSTGVMGVPTRGQEYPRYTS
jgi:hypothetical protein